MSPASPNDEADSLSADLRALAPSFHVSAEGHRGTVSRLDIRLPGERRDENVRQLAALLDHPHLRPVREMTVSFSFQGAHEDPQWALGMLAARRFDSLDAMFVTARGPVALEPLASAFRRPAALGTWIVGRGSSFADGPYANVQILDLRDAHVEWNPSSRAPSWPDLEILILRPRGDRKDRWAEQILRSPQPFPKLREVWAPEYEGDAIIDVLVRSPVLGQLRRLDLTGSVTNAGAAVLAENAQKLEAIDELYLGSPGKQRRALMQMARVTNPRFAEPPLGTLEIDDAWQSRLRERLGEKVSFRVPEQYPHLDLAAILRGKRSDPT